MSKVIIALILGILSLFVFMFGLETVAPIFGGIAVTIVIVIVMMAYFFICQFLLSRGNPNALFKDWPIMLALGVAPIVIVFVTALDERQEVFLTERLGFLIVCFAGIFAGAFVAARAASRKAKQQQ